MLDSNVGLWFVWPRIAPSRVSVTVYKLIWALTDGSHRSMLLGCINCDSQPAAVHFFRRSTFRSLPARLMTGGGYRLLASGKLWRARSRLYQRRFLRPNTHFSAFFEIYKICNPLHRSKLNKFRKFLQYFW